MAHHLYGLKQYNTTKYNTDDIVTAFTETVSESDARAMLDDVMLSEGAFISDAVRREVTNKSLPETVRVNTWLQIKRKPPEVPW